MKRKKSEEYSLRRLIVLIILGAMCFLLVVQSISLSFFLRRNDERRQDYINGIVNATNASLTTIGQNIESLGSYISSYSAFQELYIERASGDVDSFVEAYQTVRFMATYVSVISDVVVVDLNSIPMSFYSPMDYSIVDRVGELYSFEDPWQTDKKFLFWENSAYFAYVVPIQRIYSSQSSGEKLATAIFVCDMEYIHSLINEENEISMALYDSNDDLIVFGGQLHPSETVAAQRFSQPMGITIRVSGSTTYGEDAYQLLRWFFIVSAIAIIICMLLVLVMLNRSIARPVADLADEIAAPALDKLKRRVPKIAIFEVNSIIDCFNQMLDENAFVTKRIFETQDKLYESELRKTEAEVYALQSQINPHFLYNTLQCIRSIAILRDVPEIADVSLAMSELFRYSIEPGDSVLFSKELSVVKMYELITSIRFQNRFLFSYDIEEPILTCQIIKMLVQPLIENAVFHGVSRREEGGCVEIKGRLIEDTVSITVADDGPGIDSDRLEQINALLNSDSITPDFSHCLGLRNIHRRIRLRYGGQNGLSIRRENGWTSVTICFPYKKV